MMGDPKRSKKRSIIQVNSNLIDIYLRLKKTGAEVNTQNSIFTPA